MNSRYSVPIVLLCLLIGAGAVTLRKQTQRFEVAKEELAVVLQDLAKEREQSHAMLMQRTEALRGSKEIERFLAEWSLHSQEASSPGPVTERLSKLSTDLNLLSARRPTPVREDYEFGSNRATVQVVGFSVTGNFQQTLNWLGAVETTFPYARIDSVSMRGRGNEVDMELQMIFLISENSKDRTPARGRKQHP